MKKVGKSDLIAAVARRLGFSKSAVASVYDEMISEIQKSLRRRRPVSIAGLGVLYTSRLKKRTMRSPQTGEMIVVPARVAVRFRASKRLKKII